MKKSERLISLARDKITLNLLDANVIFEINRTVDSDIRRLIGEKKIIPICVECEQGLALSKSIYDRHFFKHLPKHSYCLLSDNSLTPQQQNEYIEITKINESDRHKQLKNRIGNLISTVEGVDKSSIAIDNKFIFRNGEKRKPDVYCKFLDYQIVFEIQLSKLPLWYILKRHQFYKENNIYLIWVLDNFDIKSQGSFELDIKYLNIYHNFFKLDESAVSLRLLCEYKEVYIDDFIVKNKWKQKSVELNELSFDSKQIQAFYYNFPVNLAKKETELIQLLRKKEDDEWNALQIKEEEERKIKIEKIIQQIKNEKSKKFSSYRLVDNKINELSYLEVKELNNNLDFKNRKKSPIIKWIRETNEYNYSFLFFILQNKNIYVNINQSDSIEETVFLELYKNEKIPSQHYICKLFFEIGYQLQKKDIEYINLYSKNNNFESYKIWDRVKSRKLIQKAYEKDTFLFILESAKHNQIIGSKLANWITFGNNAIQFYSQYWEYIELAFKKYGIWDFIIEQDRRKTFHSKLEKLYQNFPKQEYDVDTVVKNLYPEIFN
ncbi:hypothetical protein SAMN05421786_101468 [Chryseobacterium ureilyticum]|uniref:Competence protein CoiA-like family protein n=1 Tax=Chryseobacterium ureilyticum TaxID=373668 RepID=A0A1N7KGV8_9FLAO|nr:DUF6035 family protein [Chryseobacterium ureilyticum]SIS60815.1 hypothetical protein SAMN05421786_101468 [Chryseobacterium ureilyticum]